jgi:hypothetical protein
MSILDTPSPFYTPEKTSNWPLAVRYGLIWAATGFILTLVGFLTDTDASMPSTPTSIKIAYSILSLGVAIWCIRTAIITDRDEQLGGLIEYGRAAGLGMKVGLVTGSLGAILQVIYTKVINPSYTETMLDATREQMEKQGLSDEQIDQAITYSEMFMGPIPTMILFILVALFFTLIISLIAAAVLKKSPYPG